VIHTVWYIFWYTSHVASKIQNGDILVPANPGPPGKWPLNWRTGERVLNRLPVAEMIFKVTQGLRKRFIVTRPYFA